VWEGSDVTAFHVMAAGCGGTVFRGMQGPTYCGREPVVAGRWYAAHGARCGWVLRASNSPNYSSPRGPCFLRIATRSIVAAISAAVAGQRWAGKQEGPLARGAACRVPERGRGA
jgi:hypothetical protein